MYAGQARGTLCAATMSIPYHYPPDLLELLVDTIPRLIRSKRALFDFFASSGVNESFVSDLGVRVFVNKEHVTKFEITRTVLVRLNQGGDAALRCRREVVKRVTEWEDFSTCWDSDALKAKGLVAEVRRVVGVKDAFTRIAQERDQAAAKKRGEYEARVEAVQQRSRAIVALHQRLAACFGATSPHQRGKELEKVLNEYFELSGIGIREAFHVVGERGEGIVEQIDGAVEINCRPYLVEMKWWSKPLGMPEVATFLVKLFARGGCGGIIIAHPGLTAPAATTLRDGLAQGATVVGCSLESIYKVLERGGDLQEFLKKRLELAVLDRTPYVDGAIG